MIQIIVLIVLLMILFNAANSSAKVEDVRGSNHQLLNNMHFSAQEFYESVQQEVMDQQIKGVTFSRVLYSEGGILSARRQYLRIQRKEYVFDICCAPFSKGTFVSWWLGEVNVMPLRKYLVRIPIIGPWFRPRNKTYLELDNEAMFKELIRSSFNKAVEHFSEVKGIRPNLIDSPTIEMPAMA